VNLCRVLFYWISLLCVFNDVYFNSILQDMLSAEKLEARAHQLELCKARGNLIATEIEVSPQLEYVQKLWGHLKQFGNLRVSELHFAVKLQVRLE